MPKQHHRAHLRHVCDPPPPLTGVWNATKPEIKNETHTHQFGPKGILHVCDNEEGIRARNTMHNRVKADAFVPAGGRPGTINGSNWRSYLDKDGRPSSSLVVEG